MKKLTIAVLSLMFAGAMAGIAVAGSLDSPGAPSEGSGMYTLQNLYDYLTSGTALTVQTSFQGPASGPTVGTMKSAKQIGDDVKTKFDLCDATADKVASGTKFFSTQSGRWGVQTGTFAAPYNTVFKTGQTAVYQTGDDGTYSTSKGKAFSYAWDSSTDTVMDNVTGLIWPSSGTGAGCNSNGQLVWSSAIVWAEGLNFAGSTDWRLPNKTELQTLLVLDGGAPRINKTYFPDTTTSGYWSSTTEPNRTTYALSPNFYLGFVGSIEKTRSYYVRAVRGGD
ncbi:MAG: DUF1566 domain-containing protein [Candidatus Aureabacteria bacterium]|nr:DUF1566 domain-containing protein [Candidatus Auribacterota bacterium]